MKLSTEMLDLRDFFVKINPKWN